MKMLVLPAVVASVLASGCATFHSPSSRKELNQNQSYWMSYDASRRGAIILAENSNVRTCSEPAPDVALSFANSLKGDFKLPGDISATGVATTLNASAMALAGRDNVVLLARETLFRICEASINGTVAASEVQSLFKDVFQQVKEIAKAQAQKAKSDADSAKSRVQQLQLLQAK